MPRLSQTVTVSTTKQITIKPQLRTKLLKQLRAYAEVRAQEKEFKKERERITGVIRELREATGEGSLQLEGFTTTDVGGETSKLSVDKLLALGVSKAWIEEATTRKPKKRYEKITLPGESEDDE